MKLIPALILVAVSAFAADDHFVPLFPKDGPPAGFVVRHWADVSKPPQDAAEWVVENGVLTSKGARGCWLMSEKEYGNFTIEYEFRLGPRGNSGLALRAPLQGDPAFDGMEMQMADFHYNEQAKDSELTGGIYRAIAPVKQVYKPEEWNSMRVTLDGARLTIVMNGETIQERDLEKFDATVPRHDGTPAPAIKDRPRTGHIGFQELSRDGSHVLIRNARIAVQDLKIGVIGMDTSHVTAFTKLLNDATAPEHVPGGKVVAAFKSGSADIPSSIEHVEEYATVMQRDFGVKFVPTIEELCREVDCVLLLSVDGRPHLAQARPVIAAKKRLFIDKPIGGTLRDAVEIFRLAKEAGVPVFTSSAYRYYDSMVEVKKTAIGEVRSAISYGPSPLEEHHPDLFWYGVHPTEALFTVMGRGCESVARTSSADADAITGTWSGGRLGVLHAIRTAPLPHKVTIFGRTGFAEQKPGADSYAPLVREIMGFFQTGVPPVAQEETLEIFAFMEAADESKRRGGATVKLSEVLEKAR